MKKVLSIILILSIFSCSNKGQKELNGSWYNLSKEYTDKFQFKKDSLIIIDYGLNKSKYKVENNLIKFNYKHKFGDSIKQMQLKYEISKNGDTLKIQSKKDSIPEKLLLKAESYLDFLFKKNNVTIDLELNQSADYIPITPIAINVYIENKGGNFKGKTEFSENLESINKDLENLEIIYNDHLNRSYNDYTSEILNYSEHKQIPKISTYKKRWMKQYFQFQIFADKSIPQNKIDEIILNLKENYEFRIYQIYFTPENTNAPINFLKGVEN